VIKLTHISLFSGIGGIDIAAEWAGFETILFVEKNEYCQKVLKKHWPDVPIIGDIRDVKGDEIQRPITIISGGFPCQDVSIAGKREGLRGHRSTLWEEFYRIVCKVKPRWVLVENVRGLLSSDNGQFLGAILRDLARIRYDAEWGVLRASWFRIPQDRDRIFIIAYPSQFSKQAVFYKDTINVESYREGMDGKGCKSSNTNYENNRESTVPVLGDTQRAEYLTESEAETMMGFPIGWTDLDA